MPATRLLGTFLLAVFATSCGSGNSSTTSTTRRNHAARPQTLSEARKGFQSKITASRMPNDAVERPPAGVFNLVQYPSDVGNLPAYLTPDPRDGKKPPAIVWITGGDCSSIGDVWTPAPAENDQTASAFRQAGIVMMFPSLRGGNRNPGRREGFYGEVNDIRSAIEHVRKLPYVDPARVYLGGHSTGGTLALLAVEGGCNCRAVFSFGPAHDVRGYDPQFLPFDTATEREIELRSPVHWLDHINARTLIIEGENGNADSIKAFGESTSNLNVKSILIPGHDHFSVLLPATKALAAKIVSDTGTKCEIDLTPAEIR